jgi:trk system potassium uptake protein TrkA
MASQLAKKAFNVRHVLCRIYDPVRAEAYKSLGIDTICPTVRVADIFMNSIQEQMEVAG